MESTTADWAIQKPRPPGSGEKRSLIGACFAHLLHDGYTDSLYVLLPVWQSEFGLSYAALAIVRALYYGTMGGLQVPSDKILAKLNPRMTLFLATLIAAFGFLVMALPLGFLGLCSGLVLAGIGSSVQHPRASVLVTNSYGKNYRVPLGIYNFAGDLGKSAFPALVAILLPLIAWRPVAGILAGAGIIAALCLLAILPTDATQVVQSGKTEFRDGRVGRGFGLLLTIGTFDTATRMGYLLFLPFLLRAKGAHTATIGLGLALIFAGGALGKACCGWLGQHVGVVRSVVITEAATALLIVITLELALKPMLLVLPLLGVVLNGTSSVLYGTVPAFARDGEVGRAFALFYTGVIGAGGLAPIAYGAIADHSTNAMAIIAAALTAAAIIPMAACLTPFLPKN